jgi:ubiquinone biosynthesis protein
MADLLGQLFAYTDVFDMKTRPELILLQKSMVIVEGVARSLDPSLNMWVAAEPVAKEWVSSNYGARGAVKKAGEGATTLARVLAEVPTMLAEAERASAGLAEMARGGLKLDPETIESIGAASRRGDRWTRLATWIGAASLAVLAAKYVGWL